jgi:hypothetical protein
MKRVFGKGRYASVTSTLALIVALGGTSYAAIKLPANSVGSNQIKRGGVAGVDIRSGAVTSPKVKDGSLLGADFKPGQLPAGAKGDRGDRGVPGPAGPITSDLPRGVTLRGTFASQGTGAGNQARQGVSFGLQLAIAPTPHYIKFGTAVPDGCTGGTVTAPAADPGHLCIYEGGTTNASATRGFLNPIDDSVTTVARWGFGVYVNGAGAGSFVAQGTWAVTAP